jgi:hypothetical protein
VLQYTSVNVAGPPLAVVERQFQFHVILFDGNLQRDLSVQTEKQNRFLQLNIKSLRKLSIGSAIP